MPPTCYRQPNRHRRLSPGRRLLRRATHNAMVTCPAIAICHAIATCCHHSIHCRMVGISYPNTHQIRRTANAALEASTPSRHHRERGRGSGSRAHSRSPPGLESSRKRRRSRSLKYEQGSPLERREKRSRDGVQRPRRDRLEFFQSGAGPHGGACTVCLGRHEHTFSKCNGAKLWDGSARSARKNEQGRLVAADCHGRVGALKVFIFLSYLI